MLDQSILPVSEGNLTQPAPAHAPASAPVPAISAPLWRGRDVLIIGLTSLGLMLGLMLPAVGLLMLVNRSNFVTFSNPQNMLIISTIAFAAEAIGLIAAVWWFGLRRRKVSWAQIGLRPIASSWIVNSVMITIAAAIIGGAAAVFVQTLLGGDPNSNPQAQAIAPAGFSWPAAISMTFLGGIAVPIGEEIFFRGVLHQWASAKWGALIGSVVSSLVFGLSHGIPAIIAFAFVMGLAIAFAYEKTKSLWPGIIIHIINNSLKIALLYGLLANGLPL